MSIDLEWEKVRDFHMAFCHPVADLPMLMTSDRAKKRYKWMMEEINEFLESNTLEDQADAMIDLIYFALGTLVELGIKPEGMFEIVHQANMSKLGKNGKPNFNEDGKVIKPTTWESPEPKLKKEIQRQIRKANNV